MHHFYQGVLALLLSGLCWASSADVQAQKATSYRSSGTIFSPESQTYIIGLREKVRYWDDSTSRGFTDVPVKIHLVSKSDGTGGLPLSDVKTGINNLNQQYAKAYLRFVPLDEYGQILNDDFYKMNRDVEEELCKSYDAKNVLNIYIVSSIRGSTGGCCAYTHPPMPNSAQNKNRIFITQRCYTGKLALARQVAHYLGLFPTHGVNEGRSEELVDGSNCETAGDYICDTPADPGITPQMMDARCNYISSLQDGKGKYYRPLVGNPVSDNTRPECASYFTSGQLQHMTYFAKHVRNYLVFPKSGYSSKDLKHLKKNNGIEGRVNLLVDGSPVSAELVGNLTRAKVNGKRVQLQLQSQQKAHIYVFEGDTGRQMQLVYPLPNDQQFLKDETVEFTVPMKGSGIEIPAGAKRSYYCVLYCRRPINKEDFLKKLNKEDVMQLSPLQRIYAIYEDLIIPTHEVQFSTGGGLKFSTLATERYILPIITELVH